MTARVRRLVRPFASEIERLVLAEDSTDQDVQRLDTLLGVLAGWRDELAATSEARATFIASAAQARDRLAALLAELQAAPKGVSPAKLAELAAVGEVTMQNTRSPVTHATARAKDIREVTARLYAALPPAPWTDLQTRESFLEWLRWEQTSLRATKASPGEVAKAVASLTRDAGELPAFQWVYKRLATAKGQALLRAEIERSLQRGRPKGGTAQRRDTFEALTAFLFDVRPAAILKARRRSKK